MLKSLGSHIKTERVGFQTSYEALLKILFMI